MERTLEPNAIERLAVHFTKKADDGDYKFTLFFDDGSFLDIFVP